jgi:hypothetical protein
MDETPKDGQSGDLREKLEALHAELQRVQSVDRETQTLLGDILEDTRHLIEHEGEGVTERHQALNSRLVAALAEFEGSHPDLAYVMARVVDTLSGLGI